jgi:hypothetical protein
VRMWWNPPGNTCSRKRRLNSGASRVFFVAHHLHRNARHACAYALCEKYCQCPNS